jgi:hypothetical protein
MNYPKLELISGFSAKSIASGHFMDNAGTRKRHTISTFGQYTIVESGNFATASVYGLKERKAIYRGLGCNSDRQRF